MMVPNDGTGARLVSGHGNIAQPHFILRYSQVCT
jgi:hypothetical protein